MISCEISNIRHECEYLSLIMFIIIIYLQQVVHLAHSLVRRDGSLARKTLFMPLVCLISSGSL